MQIKTVTTLYVFATGVSDPQKHAESVTMMRFDTLGPFEDWECKTEKEKQDIFKLIGFPKSDESWPVCLYTATHSHRQTGQLSSDLGNQIIP